MPLSLDLEAVQVAFAVPHDLVRPVPLLVGVGALPVAGVHVLGAPAHGAAESEVRLEHGGAVPHGPGHGIHEAGGRVDGRLEAAVEEGVEGRGDAGGLRVVGAGPVLVQDLPEGGRPRAGRPEGPVVAVGPVHHPGGELRVVQARGDVVGEQAAGEEGLGGEGELAAAVGDRRREPQGVGHVPDERLQEVHEPVVVEPRDGDRLHAVLEDLRIDGELHLEVLEALLAPAEVEVLALRAPGVLVGIALHAVEHGAGPAVGAPCGVALRDLLPDLLLGLEHPGVLEVEVLPLRRRAHLRPLPDGLRVAERGLDAGPGVAEVRGVGSAVRGEHRRHRVGGGGALLRAGRWDLDFFAMTSPPPSGAADQGHCAVLTPIPISCASINPPTAWNMAQLKATFPLLSSEASPTSDGR